MQEFLREKLGNSYWISPTCEFTQLRPKYERRRCQPDGLIHHLDEIIIVEIKAQHMPEAWWQLRKLYQPVVEAWLGSRSVRLLEVCKTFDPAMPFPEPFELIQDLDAWLASDVELGVFRWKP